MAVKIHITVKEKILIHLLSYSKYKEEVEVPVQVSQEGMAKAVGVRRSHIASALKDLKDSGHIEEKKARVIGEKRRKNAYFLTHEGQADALRLKKAVLEKKILLKAEDGTVKEIEIPRLKDHIEEKLGVLEILNRLDDEGVFDVKRKEEPAEEELERTVICPFCAQTNKNFELKKVELSSGATGLSVTCFFCGREFLAAEISLADQEEAKGYAPTFLPSEIAPEEYAPPPFVAANPFLVSLGLFFMLASFLFAMMVGLEYISSGFFVLVPIGFVISLALLYIGLMEVKHLDAITRRILIVTGAIFVGFIALFVGVMLDAEYEAEEAWIMASVVLPAFGVFIFGKPLARSLRSELSLSLGVFLVLFGVFTIIFFEFFSWSAWYSPFWVIAGSMMMFTSYEIERLDRTFILRAVAVGVGAFVAIFCAVIIISEYSALGPWKVLSAFLWFLFGVFLVLFRFLEQESYEKSFQAMRSTLLSGLGVLFVLVGILLAMNGRYIECGVEFFIGIPIIWYGLVNVREYEPLQVGLISFVIFSEIFTVFSLVLA
jgi:DNA-binding PadR family transcriptional regulator